jgi:hypothetical protein
MVLGAIKHLLTEVTEGRIQDGNQITATDLLTSVIQGL